MELGKEKKIEYVYDQSIGTSRQVNVTTERQHFGFVLNQTANFTLMKQFFIGIDGGIGINYYDKRKTGTRNQQCYFCSTISYGFRLQILIQLLFLKLRNQLCSTSVLLFALQLLVACYNQGYNSGSVTLFN